MAAIIVREHAKATGRSGLADVRAKACDMVQRAMAYAAATIMMCAVAAVLLNSLRRHLRGCRDHQRPGGVRSGG